MNRMHHFARMFGVVLAIGTAVSLVLVAPAAARKGDGDSARQEVGFHATTLGRSDFEIVLVQYWSKGARFRSETIVTGHPIVTLVNDRWYYTWDALSGEGYGIKRAKSMVAADRSRARPFGMELKELLDEGGEKVRSEDMNGIPVDVYRVTDDDGRRTLWVDVERFNLPVRLESYSRKTGRTGSMDWINWIPGLVIPDSFFELPKGLEVERFDSYEAYLEKLGEAPVPPAPPLFRYLLHDPSAATD